MGVKAVAKGLTTTTDTSVVATIVEAAEERESQSVVATGSKFISQRVNERRQQIQDKAQISTEALEKYKASQQEAASILQSGVRTFSQSSIFDQQT